MHLQWSPSQKHMFVDIVKTARSAAVENEATVLHVSVLVVGCGLLACDRCRVLRHWPRSLFLQHQNCLRCPASHDDTTYAYMMIQCVCQRNPQDSLLFLFAVPDHTWGWWGGSNWFVELTWLDVNVWPVPYVVFDTNRKMTHVSRTTILPIWGFSKCHLTIYYTLLLDSIMHCYCVYLDLFKFGSWVWSTARSRP